MFLNSGYVYRKAEKWKWPCFMSSTRSKAVMLTHKVGLYDLVPIFTINYEVPGITYHVGVKHW